MPIFGNALQMEEDSQHLWFEKLAMDHGPVMRVKLYESENIILSSMDVVNEAMTTRGRLKSETRLQTHLLTKYLCCPSIRAGRSRFLVL